MTQQEQDAVRIMLNGKAWLLVEQLLCEELNKSMKIDISKPHLDIAVDTIANTKFKATVDGLINKLNNIKNGKSATPVSYK